MHDMSAVHIMFGQYSYAMRYAMHSAMLCYAMLCYDKNMNYIIASHQRSCHTIFLMALCNTLIVLNYVLTVNDNARVKLVYAMLCYEKFVLTFSCLGFYTHVQA